VRFRKIAIERNNEVGSSIVQIHLDDREKREKRERREAAPRKIRVPAQPQAYGIHD